MRVYFCAHFFGCSKIIRVSTFLKDSFTFKDVRSQNLIFPEDVGIRNIVSSIKTDIQDTTCSVSPDIKNAVSSKESDIQNTTSGIDADIKNTAIEIDADIQNNRSSVDAAIKNTDISVDADISSLLQELDESGWKDFCSDTLAASKYEESLHMTLGGHLEQGSQLDSGGQCSLDSQQQSSNSGLLQKSGRFYWTDEIVSFYGASLTML